MFTPTVRLRPCVSLRLITHSHRLSFFSKYSPSLVFLSPSKSTTMSSRRSAFDALMSTARAAAAAKRKPAPPQSTSLKKPKTLGPQVSANDTLAGSVESPLCNGTGGFSTGNDVQNPTAKERPANVNAEKGEFGIGISKKMRNENRIVELKKKILLLKNKSADFDPEGVACWGKGERVPFIFLCLAMDMIANEGGRIVITDIVCNMFRTVMDTTPDDLLAVVYLLANKVAPAHEGVELGIGEAIIIKALAEAFGRTEKEVKKQAKDKGDLGLVAKESRTSQSMMRMPNALTIAKVFNTFRLIAKESGKDSQDKKKNHIKSLLVAATDCEPQYLIRLLQKELRIGLAEKTLLAALGLAALYTEKHSIPSSYTQSRLEEAVKIIKEVYSVLPVYDKIVPALIRDGIWNLPKTCSFTPGVPVSPMLAKATKEVSEIINKFQNMEFTCEYKYDGERAQIHYMEDGSVEIYSRNAERNTVKYPDVVAAISRLKKSSVKSFILDCELVAYDREKGKILPFQILSTRPRKNVVMSDIKVNVCIYAFDILYLNSQSLIQEQLDVRRERLYNAFKEELGFFEFATAITSNDLEEIQKFLDAAVNASCEGLIIKTLNKDATYEPSKRSNNWLKLKKDYMDSIGDSLDLVPIAAFHGRGKRTGVYGAFLLASYDSKNDEYQSICKVGTGFSEAMLEERSASLRPKVIPKPKPYYRYGDTINPDVWFEPSEVWEVKAADLTISPVHRAAIGEVDPDKGISLRFPRLLRVRTEKSPEDATTSDQVAEMYNAQKNNRRNNIVDDEDD